ncbi:MAG: hypothetical protein QOH60_1607, partial [Mycobacterium sp.]|nr:hypothetical protein [Mycobacterium sp.]
VKAIKSNWGEGDNLDAFNLAYITARNKPNNMSHEDALMYAARQPKTAEWAAAEGFTQIEIGIAVQHHDTQLFDHVVIYFRKP